jgi:hypothetical protein
MTTTTNRTMHTIGPCTRAALLWNQASLLLLLAHNAQDNPDIAQILHTEWTQLNYLRASFVWYGTSDMTPETSETIVRWEQTVRAHEDPFYMLDTASITSIQECAQAIADATLKLLQAFDYELTGVRFIGRP